MLFCDFEHDCLHGVNGASRTRYCQRNFFAVTLPLSNLNAFEIAILRLLAKVLCIHSHVADVSCSAGSPRASTASSGVCRHHDRSFN